MAEAHVHKDQTANPALRGPPLHKYLWVYLICGFLGVVNETILVYAGNQVFEIHSGLLFVPFVPLYGVAGVLMAVLLGRFDKTVYIFLAGAALGGIFEFLTSFGQEQILGSISWDYSAMPLNINGRTTLVHMLYWGLLGVVFTRLVYPLLIRLYDSIPQRVVNPVVLISFLLLLLLTLFTLLAVIRYFQRFNGLPAVLGWQQWMDRHFPDSTILRHLPMLTQLH